MSQTRRQSFHEALTNTTCSFGIYLVAQLAVFPLIGIQATVLQNLQYTLAMSVISFAKYYGLRRRFNKGGKK